MKMSNLARTHRVCEEMSKAIRIKTAAFAVAALIAGANSPLAQDTLDINPAPAAIGADVPATYFGPQPSSVQRELIGEYQN